MWSLFKIKSHLNTIINVNKFGKKYGASSRIYPDNLKIEHVHCTVKVIKY